MDPVDLETFVARELRRLPAPRAPHTLLPRVLAAVEAWTARPWYARAWFTWPIEWQVVLVAALILLVAGAAMLLPGAWESNPATPVLARVMGDLSVISVRAEVLTNAAQVLWRTLLTPFLPYALALVVLMCLACIVFGVALNRVAFERTFQS
jgi:hypothetical protein